MSSKSPETRETRGEIPFNLFFYCPLCQKLVPPNEVNFVEGNPGHPSPTRQADRFYHSQCGREINPQAFPPPSSCLT